MRGQCKALRTKANPGGPTLHLRTQWAWHVLEGAGRGGMGHQTPSSTDLGPCNLNGLACRKQSLHDTYARSAVATHHNVRMLTTHKPALVIHSTQTHLAETRQLRIR